MLAAKIIFALGFAMNLVLALSNRNVALYWGQNSYGDQKRLSYYCDSDDFDVVIVSFVNDFPQLNLNLANQCGDTFSNGLLHCPTVGQDIKTCQAKGKKVLLSFGGAYGNYGFSSDAEAAAFATTVWNKFGGGSDAERPFDDAIVDGFDLDLENKNQVGTVAFANALKALYSADSSKSYYLSASPQCPYPDASVGEVLANVPLDFAFIQFYNNQCSLDASFNWNTWAAFAASAPNPDIQLFVGLPGGPRSAGSGFVLLPTVEQKITKDVFCNKNFGGFSLWDASSATNNVDINGNNFYVQLNKFLSGATCSSSSSSMSSSTASSSVASSSTASSSVASSSTAASSVASSSVAASASASASASSASAAASVKSSTTVGTSSAAVTPSTIAYSSAVVTLALYPYSNSTSSSVGETDVVKTTVLSEVFTTVCPGDNGALTTITTTHLKTVTFTGECECTKGAKTSAPASETPATKTNLKTKTVTKTCTDTEVCHAETEAPAVTSGMAVSSGSEQDVTLTVYLTLTAGNGTSSGVPAQIYSGASSKTGMSLIAVLFLSLVQFF